MTTPIKDSHFISYSPEFESVIGPNPQFFTVIETHAHEGPVYIPKEDALYFTTLPQSTLIPFSGNISVSVNRISHPEFPKGELTTVLFDSNAGNGMTRDPSNDDLLICEQGSKITPARISRFNTKTFQRETVVDKWRELPFNSPNDIVVKSDGSIWFTDPSYGFLQGFKNAPLVGDYVYRYDPKTNQISVVADSFNKPNGLAFSPDEKILYINDSAAIQAPGSYHINLPHHIRAFDVIDGKKLANDRLFAVISPGIPDGLKVDLEGHVYSSSASGIQVFNKQSDLIGEILAPGVANFAFGGKQGDVIFIMADKFIWAAKIQAQGIRI